MGLTIRGLGTAVPPHAIGQTEAALVGQRVCCGDLEQAQALASLYRQTGIRQRHMVFGHDIVADVMEGSALSGSAFLPKLCLDSQGPRTQARMARYAAEAMPLALAACRQALGQSVCPPGDVTHLVTVSCTGFKAPGLDIGLQKELGLNETVARTNIGFMGCHGAINGLRVAQAFAAGDRSACVLLCCVELCSIHYHYGWDPKKMVANSLFADGAAALVGVWGEENGRDDWTAVATGSDVFPECEYAMTWSIGDHGFEMGLSTRVPALISAHLRPWLDRWLAAQGLGREEIGCWVVHPGGPRILMAVEQSLGLPHSALADSRDVLADCGNMSSPTILFIVDRCKRRNAPRPCVALAFGPGLVVEAALFI
jgi:predicted naringenin-chalcone synthase